MYQVFNENNLSDHEKWFLKNLRMLGFCKPASLRELNIEDPSMVEGLNKEADIDERRYTALRWSDVMTTFPSMRR